MTGGEHATVMRGGAALAALAAGILLIGTSGATFVIGWALWALGLATLLSVVPDSREDDAERDPGAVTQAAAR